MQTSKWGPPMWQSLEAIAHNYDPAKHNKQSFKMLFAVILSDVLPCIYCRESYKKFVEDLPLTDKMMDTREGLTNWLYQIHCKVNDKLRNQGLSNKKIIDPPFKSVCAKYDKWRADCSKQKDLPATCRIPEIEDRCSSLTSKGKRCTRYKHKGCKGMCLQHYKK